MTTRSRPRSRPGGTGSYTARLYQHRAKPRRPRPTWRTARSLPAALTLAGEAGHLAAALVEWPGAPARGLAHVVAAAGLGLLTVVLYFGRSRVELVLGTVSALTVPVVWFAGALAGLSLYHDFPLPAAIVVSALELGAAALLVVHLRLAG